MKLNEINSLQKYNFSCIYLWTNIINNKKYVGQARNFYKRMSGYRNGKFNKYMSRAIKKYGLENFEITILEKDLSFDVLDEREQHWLDYYKSYERENGYNICRVAGNTYGFRHSNETKRALRKIAKARYENPNYRERFIGENNPMYGTKHSKEWRRNHSDFMKSRWEDENYRKEMECLNKGENNPMYGVRLYGELNGMYGKKHSDETRAKISANLKHKRKVKCVETGVVYDSITQASKSTNISRTGIGAACRKEFETSGGFHWEYVND